MQNQIAVRPEYKIDIMKIFKIFSYKHKYNLTLGKTYFHWLRIYHIYIRRKLLSYYKHILGIWFVSLRKYCFFSFSFPSPFLNYPSPQLPLNSISRILFTYTIAIFISFISHPLFRYYSFNLFFYIHVLYYFHSLSLASS